MDQLVSAFCEELARANSSSDFGAIGRMYADTFLFAGPRGAQSVKKDDFLKAIPRMKAHFASRGLTGTRLSLVEANSLDSRYVLAKVSWTMTLNAPPDVLKTFDVWATYLLTRDEQGRLSIVLQLDHQDLAEVLEAERTTERV